MTDEPTDEGFSIYWPDPEPENEDVAITDAEIEELRYYFEGTEYLDRYTWTQLKEIRDDIERSDEDDSCEL